MFSDFGCCSLYSDVERKERIPSSSVDITSEDVPVLALNEVRQCPVFTWYIQAFCLVFIKQKCLYVWSRNFN